MARQREMYGHFYEGDFGLSALTEKLCTNPAPLDGAQALSLAAEVAGLCDGEGAVELGVDVRSLLDSALPDPVLHAVWLAATRRRFDPADHGMNIRGWLRRLSDLYPDRSRKTSHRYWPAPPRPDLDENRLCEAVGGEIRACAADVTQAMAASGLDARLSETVPAALERVVQEADGELGFRLFLRTLKAYRVPVDKERFDHFMVLDEELGYPGPLVYDGLTVRWPPVDTTRRDTTGDFGYSELSSRMAGHWHGSTPREAVRQAAAGDESGQAPGSQAAVLLQDAVRLLESPLATDTLAILWAAASDRGFDIEQFGMDGRSWLRLIAEVCGEHLAEVAPSYAFSMPPARSEMTDAVMRETRELKPLFAGRTISPHWQGISGPTAVEAVEDVVVRADPDLGYRLFLRLLHVLAVPLTAEQYARCHALGMRFGYGAYHVSDALEQFVEPD